jgi:hypothetical protein
MLLHGTTTLEEGGDVGAWMMSKCWATLLLLLLP